jgi:hypothetical protein
MTLINADVEISLVNPYPTDSVVDLSFTTSEGLEVPQDFQGLVVPGGGMLNVDLGSHLRRRQAIATSVSARNGQVVAWETQWANQPKASSPLLGTAAAQKPLADPAWPIPGVTVALGAPSAGTEWVWPDGIAGNGVQETYVIYNPGATVANVRLSLDLDQGSAEPFDLTVGPYQVVPVVSDQQARIPAGVVHSGVLVSTNGVPVVASRVVAAGTASTWTGLGEVSGGRVAAARWLLPDAVASPGYDGWVVLYNPTQVKASVSIVVLRYGHRDAGPNLTVPAGSRVAVHLNQKGRHLEAALVVSSSVPLYAESDFYALDATPGISLSFGVPLS